MRWETERRKAVRIGAGAGIAGVALAVLSALAVLVLIQDPFGDVAPAAYLKGIAGARGLWVLLHFAVTIGTALRLAGLLTVGETFQGTAARPLAVIGNGFSVAGVALLIVTYSRDGYVHPFLTQSLTDTPGVQDAIFAASSRAGYSTEITGLLLIAGLAPIAYGLAMLVSPLYSRWIAWLGITGGAGAVVTAAYLYSTGLTDLGYGVLYPLFGMLVPAVWLIAAALPLWRTPDRAAVATPAEV
ncbi:hypothetical protein ACIBHX_45145 [Nonomuraea sp. NPDC050536]|uniref:hypothetical protein n=1 Tax=Nonomuraea sp. NPDC050536 TaxID=3364366 RepID=UPI0037CBB462